MAGYVDVAPGVEDRVRAICLALPAVEEERAWTGSPRWLVRRRTFAHLLAVEPEADNAFARLVDAADAWPVPAAPVTIVVFRSAGEELMALRHLGPPYLDAGFGRNAMAMILDAPDWSEVAELLTESYRLLAPTRLVAELDGDG